MKYQAFNFKKKNPFDVGEKADYNKEIFTPRTQELSDLKPKLFSPPEVEDQEVYDMIQPRHDRGKDNHEPRRKRLFKDFYSMLKDDSSPIDSDDVVENENHEKSQTDSLSNSEEYINQDSLDKNPLVEEFNSMLSEEPEETNVYEENNRGKSRQKETQDQEFINVHSSQFPSKKKRNPFKEDKVNPFDVEDYETHLEDYCKDNHGNLFNSVKEEKSLQQNDELEHKENVFVEEFISLLGVEDQYVQDKISSKDIDFSHLIEQGEDESLESQVSSSYEDTEDCISNTQNTDECIENYEIEPGKQEERGKDGLISDDHFRRDEVGEIKKEMLAMLDEESEDETSIQFMEDVIVTLNGLEKIESFPLKAFLELLTSEYCEDSIKGKQHTDEQSLVQEDEAQGPNIKEDLNMLVKLPVKLSHTTLQLDLLKWVPLPINGSTIYNINCLINYVEATVPLPSSVIFFEGEVLLDIEFETNENTNSLHKVRVPIEWKEYLDVEWKEKPNSPEEFKQKYTSFCHTEGEDIYEEWYFKPVNPIVHQIQGVKSLWQFEQDSQYLQLFGTLTLAIDLYQTQYVSI